MDSAVVSLLVPVILAILEATPRIGDAIVYPVSSARVTSGFGLREHPIRKIKCHHAGVDISAPSGTPVRALTQGRITYAGALGGYGNLVVIEHRDHITSHYGHLAKIAVQLGQFVSSGEIIGSVGASGDSTAPHLHLEIRNRGQPFNPELVLSALESRGLG